MNCSKLIHKCKSSCCSIVPFPVDINVSKAVRPYKKVRFGEIMFLNTEDHICPFLDPKALKCIIYETRPDVCRKYGNETHICLTCCWQDKNGKIRPRAERRRIDHKQKEYLKKFNIKDIYQNPFNL